MSRITLRGRWHIKASVRQVFDIITDFERYPAHFPRVAESIQITRRDGNNLEISAKVRSFGRCFPVKMRTQILPDKGFISDNESPGFGTSGHEELLLTETPEGTEIDYSYQVTIHKRWLSIIAKPLISWYSMRYWEKAVIDELKKLTERQN